MITPEMRQLIEYTRLAYVATVNPDGTANLSPKGSLKVLDDQHLGFANIASPNTIRNIASNASVEINVLDPVRRRGFRFKGTAQFTNDPEILDVVAAGLGAAYPVDGAVRIAVTSTAAVWSPVYDHTEQTEPEVVEQWLDIYGYNSPVR